MTDKGRNELVHEIDLLKGRIKELEKLYGELRVQQQHIKRFETVVEDSNDSIIIQSLEGKITTWNLGAEKMYGYKASEALGMSIERLTPIDKVEEYNDFTRRLMNGEMVTSFETQRVTKNGAILDVWLTVSRIEERPEDCIILTGRDVTIPTGGIALFERNITERKRFEKELAKQKENFLLVLEATNDAFWDWNIETNQTSRNARYAQMLGYEPDEISSDQSEWEKAVHPDDRDVLMQLSKEILSKQRDSFELEYRMLTKTGGIVWVLGKGKVVGKADDGSPLRMLGTNSDITERKKLDETLRDSQKQFVALTSNIPGVIYRCANDPHWTMRFISNEIEFITGYPAADFLNNIVRSFVSIIHPDDLDKVKAAVQEGVRKKESFEIRYRLIHKEGRIIPVFEKGRGVFNEHGDLICLDGAIFDVSREERYQTEIEQSQHLLKKIINLIPLRIFWKDRSLKYLGANEAFAKDAGLESPEDLIGKDDYQMKWSEQAELYRADDMEVINQNKKKRNIEEPQTTPFGDVIWLSTNKVPLRNEQGEVTGVVGVYDDITLRKKDEERLQELLKDLKQFKDLTIDRENVMIKLKQEVNQLSKELGKGEPYDLSFLD